MLENEKAEINRWLMNEYPEVFKEKRLKELQKKFEEKEKSFKKSVDDFAEKLREKERPIYVESDVLDILTHQIDAYLLKNWPDIFDKKRFAEIRDKIDMAMKSVQEADRRMRPNIMETIERCNKMCDANYQKMFNLLEERIKALEKKMQPRKTWWKKFFNEEIPYGPEADMD